MKAAWPTVKLGEVLRRSVETVTPDTDQEYSEITVRLWGNGVVQRGRILGASVNGRRFIARRGQFIASRIDARNGAMGLVPESLDGALVTNDFPLFAVASDRMHPEYLGWLSKTKGFVELCAKGSEGTTNRVRLKEDKFLGVEIPLPPIAEQRRIVAKIEELAAQIAEGRALRSQTVSEMDLLCRSLLACDPSSRPTPMRELVKLRAPDVTVSANEQYPFAGVYCFGRGVFKAQVKAGMDFAYPKLTRLKSGNFVYPKLMAWEGAFGVVPPECDGCVVSTEFPVFEVIEAKVLPEVLDTYFRNPSVWPAIAGSSTGTNVRRRRLNPSDFLAYKMPLSSMATQLRFREVRQQAAELKRLHAETATELDALLPAILDRAFNGDL